MLESKKKSSGVINVKKKLKKIDINYYFVRPNEYSGIYKVWKWMERTYIAIKVEEKVLSLY